MCTVFSLCRLPSSYLRCERGSAHLHTRRPAGLPARRSRRVLGKSGPGNRKQAVFDGSNEAVFSLNR